MLCMIAAMGRHRVIGRDNQLPWRIPADLQRFRTLTRGHHVVMGRKTFESIGRPLPGRTNVVITHQPAFAAPGVHVVHDLPSALALCAGDAQPFIIGGGEIYRLALPLTDRVYLTEVDAAVDGGDAFFPELSTDEWTLASVEDGPDGGQEVPPHRYLVYERRT